MSQFFTLNTRKSSIAYVQKDGDQFTIVHRNGRRLIVTGTLDPTEFPLTEVDEATALALIKPERPDDRQITTTVIGVRSGTFPAASSITDQDIDSVVDAVNKAIQKGTITSTEIRDAIVKALRKTPTPPTP